MKEDLTIWDHYALASLAQLHAPGISANHVAAIAGIAAKIADEMVAQRVKRMPDPESVTVNIDVTASVEEMRQAWQQKLPKR